MMLDFNKLLTPWKLFSTNTTHIPVPDLFHPPPTESVSEVKIRKEMSEG